jgi:hypothetical protein
MPFNEFLEAEFAFKDFKPYVNGKLENSKDLTLNLSRISAMGFKVEGRPLVGPEGVASFEIDYIVAFR